MTNLRLMVSKYIYCGMLHKAGKRVNEGPKLYIISFLFNKSFLKCPFDDQREDCTRQHIKNLSSEKALLTNDFVPDSCLGGESLLVFSYLEVKQSIIQSLLFNFQLNGTLYKLIIGDDRSPDRIENWKCWFWGEGKLKHPEKNLLEQERELNPHMTPSSGSCTLLKHLTHYF